MTGPKQARSDGGKRFYSWRNERYWSVTTIVNGGLPKPVLVNWAKKFTAEYAVDHFDAFKVLVEDDPLAAVEWLKGAAFRDRDKKADLGSMVHAACEAFELGKPMPPWPVTIKPHMEHFAAFLEEYRPKIIASEASVYNRSEKYAGTLDAIATFGRRKLIFDVKTGKSVYPEVALQLAAYRYAEFIGLPDGSERAMYPVDGAAVLHLTDSGYDFMEVQAGEDIYRSFLYCRENFRFLNDVSKHVIGAVIKPPRKRKASEPEPRAGTIEPARDTHEPSSSEAPQPGSVSPDAASGSDQTTLLPTGPRTREEEHALGIDIFGEKVT